MNEKIVFNSVEDIEKSYNTGDRQKDLIAVNNVLSGNIEIKQPEPIKVADVPSVQTVSESPSIPEGTPLSTDGDTVPVVPEVIPINEYEQQKRYAEFLEQKAKDEHNLHLIEIQRREEELKQEKIAREELEKKLQQLSQLQNTQPVTSSNTETSDDEDPYVSDYAKQTRNMVEELKSRVGDNPVVKELVEKISLVENEFKQRKQIEIQTQKEKERIEKENKLFDSIRKFQISCPDLQTSKDIKELDQEYTAFRKNIAYLTNAKNTYDVDKAIDDYMKGGETKKLADERGIKSAPDLDKYNAIAELIDVKNGTQRDPVTGKFIPILDDEGNQVRYRSLDEVYKIKNHVNDINNARRQSFKEMSNKLESIQQSAVTIKNEQTTQIGGGYTPEQEAEILNWKPDVWANNPDKRRMVEEIYTKHGLEVPRYRGRK